MRSKVGHPVLQGENGEHGGRVEVLAHDGLAYPCFAFLGCLAALVQHLAPVTLGEGRVFFPPTAYTTHVVSRGGTYGVVGVVGRIVEGASEGLGHALYLK